MRRFIESIKKDKFAALVACTFLAACSVGIIFSYSHDATAQSSKPAVIFDRQIQRYCAGSKAECDISHFDSEGITIMHFVAPDPVSATIQGDWTKHCVAFANVPSWMTVYTINTQTNLPETVSDTSSFSTCEAYFTLTGS